MTQALDQFLTTAKSLAAKHGLVWNPSHDEKGVFPKKDRWNLSGLSGSATPVWFSGFGWPPNMLEALESLGPAELHPRPLSNFPTFAWRELCQAVLIDHVLVHQKAPHGAYRLARMAKVLALAAGDVPPSEMTGTHVQRAYNIALRMGDGEAARVFPSFISNLIDSYHLAIRPNLASSCIPYSDERSVRAQEKVDLANAYSNSKGYRKKELSNGLNERKDSAKLPDHRAFWELCRIVFTEEPRSLHDLQLFACVRLHIITGLRAAEIALLPSDWERWREWTDIEGRPASERGGISRSLAIRHFAGKQATKAKGPSSRQLVPKLQFVPEQFEGIVLHTLHEVEQATRPFRTTLERQLKSGRIFPDLAEDELIPIWDLHARLYGHAHVSAVPIPDELIRHYKFGSLDDGKPGKRFRFDPASLKEVRDHQYGALALENTVSGRKIATGSLHARLRSYWKDTRSKIESPNFLNEEGHPHFPKSAADWGRVHFRVREVEAQLCSQGFALNQSFLPVRSAEPVAPSEFLFLTAIDKGATRTETKVLDAEKFCWVRRFNADEVIKALGGAKQTAHLSLFARYSRNEEDRKLRIKPHALRHLQNTELFRKGLADTIITNRFNRTSVQKSYVYDHRSLAEKLDNIDVPEDVEERLGPKAGTTYRLILSGRVSGPLIDKFRAIQREEGDDAAFEYLIAEADGLHATPYGFCLNSFTVDPCPKHLECFNGCMHLARTDLPSEQENLTKLRCRTAVLLDKARASPPGSIGRENQIRHAENRLENLDKALATPVGESPFPDGYDLSVPIDEVASGTIFDRNAPVLNSPPLDLDMSDA